MSDSVLHQPIDLPGATRLMRDERGTLSLVFLPDKMVGVDTKPIRISPRDRSESETRLEAAMSLGQLRRIGGSFRLDDGALVRIKGSANAVRLIILGETGQPDFLTEMSISVRKYRNKVVVERASLVGLTPKGPSADGAIIPTAKMHDIDRLTSEVAAKFIGQLPEWSRLPITFVRAATAQTPNASGRPTLEQLREMGRLEQESTVAVFIGHFPPLTEPMSEQNIREDISHDGWITARVSVSTEELLDSSREHFPALLAKKVTGDAEKFTDVNYSVVGEQDGQNVYRVEGKVKNFQNYLEDQV